MPSPHPSTGALPATYSHSGGGGGVGGGAAERRPPLMKRHSSQASHTSAKHLASPSSAGEQHQPLRHHVKPVRKTKIVLPRNNSSARNLAKLAGARHGADGHAAMGAKLPAPRQKSHEGDTEIRLPGSLEEASSRPAMRRNLTSQNLPRNPSHTKLKKNISHGQLARLGSGRNLQALGSRGPPSPGLKGKGRRHRSADMGSVEKEKDLHEQEVELGRKQQEAREAPKKVGFALGSANESSDEEDAPEMEGSGLQEDDWTDQSASASPSTTRQNTANNSRRPSMNAEKLPEKSPLRGTVNASDTAGAQEPQNVEKSQAAEADGTPAASFETASGDEGEEDEDSPTAIQSPQEAPKPHLPPTRSETSQQAIPHESPPKPAIRNSTHAVKDSPSPFTKQLLNRNNQTSAPALLSNVSTLDVSHSARASPTPSQRSSRSNLADQPPDQEDELVSRFISSASHPSTNSGPTTTANTPRTGSYQTPEPDNPLTRREKRPQLPTSPGGSIASHGSSGATTPAIARSRTELRMQNERAIAALESGAAFGNGKPQLLIPAHRFDRRNESLKSYLNVAFLGGDGRSGTAGLPFGPEIFEGRFKAVNQELKVVQRFRDPVAESVARLQKRGDRVGFNRRRAQQRGASEKQSTAAGARMPSSSSAIGLSRQGGRAAAAPSSGSPVRGSPARSAMPTSKSSAQIGRESEARRGGGSGRGVSFSQRQMPGERRETGRAAAPGDLSGADAIARRMWDVAASAGKADR